MASRPRAAAQSPASASATAAATASDGCSAHWKRGGIVLRGPETAIDSRTIKPASAGSSGDSGASARSRPNRRPRPGPPPTRSVRPAGAATGRSWGPRPTSAGRRPARRGHLPAASAESRPGGTAPPPAAAPAVEAGQAPAERLGLGRHVQLLIGLQQQLQRRDPAGILFGHQLEEAAGGRPGAGLGVDGAQPVAQVGDVRHRAGRQHAQQLFQPVRGGGRVPAGHRQLGQRAARLDALRAQDGQLAVQGLGFHGVAGPVRQRGPSLHQLLVRDGVTDGRGALEGAVEMPGAGPVLAPEGQLACQRQRGGMVGRVGQRGVQLGQRPGQIAARQRHPGLGDQRVRSQGRLRLGAGLSPVGRVGWGSFGRRRRWS